MALPDFSAEALGQFWLDATRDVHCATAAAYGLIAVRVPRDRGQWLRAGRLWQRLHLEATVQGVAMQPLNQALELIDRDYQLNRPPALAERLAAVVGDPGWTAVFGFRAGYAESKSRASPRRGLEQVLQS
jgi:hypothetical protein